MEREKGCHVRNTGEEGDREEETEYGNRGQKERVKQREGRLTLHGTKRGGGEKEMGHSDKPKHYLS